MLRPTKLLLAAISVIFFQNSFSQKTFDVTILLTENIAVEKISCHYDNGFSTVAITDTFAANILHLKGKYYSQLASIDIAYNINETTSFTNKFFIGKKPAQISVHYNPNNINNRLEYTTLVNATPIFDTAKNIIWKQLLQFGLKEAQAVSDLWEKHAAEIFRSDSFSLLNRQLFRALNNRYVLFLTEYPEDYFSFWFFRNQIVGTTRAFFEKDTSYLKNVLASFQTIYPRKYTKSTEGKHLIKQLEALIHPPESLVNKTAPAFKLRDINGKHVRSSQFKGKYVLLDFWASWCPPCRINNPELKKINEKFGGKNFELISISIDENLEKWKAAINKDGMNWTNLVDRMGFESKYVTQYRIDVIPVYVLIDPSGKVIMQTVNELDKIQEKLEQILDRKP